MDIQEQIKLIVAAILVINILYVAYLVTVKIFQQMAFNRLVKLVSRQFDPDKQMRDYAESMLQDYKINQVLQLMVNGKVVNRGTLHHFEAMAEANGAPSDVIGFAVEFQNPDAGDPEFSQFPSN